MANVLSTEKQILAIGALVDTTVLEIPPVDSAKRAVKAAIAALAAGGKSSDCVDPKKSGD